MQAEDDEHVLKWTSRPCSSLPAASQSLPGQCGYLAMQNTRYTPRKTNPPAALSHRTAF